MGSSWDVSGMKWDQKFDVITVIGALVAVIIIFRMVHWLRY